MNAHFLNPQKGNVLNPFQLTHVAKLADGVVAYAGMVVHLNSSGLYELGIGTLDAMPMFLWQNGDDFDVANDGGDPATDADSWQAFGPEGDITAYVATGGGMFATTEFKGAASQYTAPNVLLSSDTAGGDAGKLRVGVKGTDTLCGITCKTMTLYRHTVVVFWADFQLHTH